MPRRPCGKNVVFCYVSVGGPAQRTSGVAREQVFCTPSMASFLRCNQPWAQLTERGNISLREVDITGGSDAASVSLTPSISFLPVAVPHRAELSDTVAYVIVVSRSPNVASTVVTQPELASMASSRSRGEDSAHMMKLFYCPDTDGWSGWKRGIRDWCDDMDVAFLDATFYDENELTGREMREVIYTCYFLMRRARTWLCVRTVFICSSTAPAVYGRYRVNVDSHYHFCYAGSLAGRITLCLGVVPRSLPLRACTYDERRQRLNETLGR